ncbi:C1 family peptidase, partial [Skermanella stibiiresistens]|uniref:C1 family peptidase n=1 Tax=Skermanella stibiiresistens TaxID=913326 RepID=UPI0018DD5EF2
MPDPQLDALVRTLAQTGARWQAGATPLAQLSIDQKRARLGVVVDQAALARAMAPQAVAVTPAFAPAVDWRNRNCVTPPKDQGNCGSCVSFCITGLVESMALIETGQNLDLSEADLHFCSSHGASCGGWWPDQALDQVRGRGLPDEAAFPYASAFEGSGGGPVCRTAADRDARAVKISSSGAISNITARKNHLTTVGPASAVLHVFEDFFAYTGGIYAHVSGSNVGLHCVLVIGYSEADQCWICKNSWGIGWGDGGYFRIGYGECGIDTEFPFSTGTGVKLPVRRGWS